MSFADTTRAYQQEASWYFWKSFHKVNAPTQGSLSKSSRRREIHQNRDRSSVEESLRYSEVFPIDSESDSLDRQPLFQRSLGLSPTILNHDRLDRLFSESVIKRPFATVPLGLSLKRFHSGQEQKADRKDDLNKQQVRS